jgi:hypothetical protein
LPERRQRGAQIMRRIVRDMADAGHQLLDTVEHAVQQARLLVELAARTVHAHAAVHVSVHVERIKVLRGRRAPCSAATPKAAR